VKPEEEEEEEGIFITQLPQPSRNISNFIYKYAINCIK
jgi:hypothetical protein